MGAGIGSGKGLGMRAGIGSGKGLGIGSGMGAGMGAGIGSGKGSGMGSGMGLGMRAGAFPVPVECQELKFGSGKTLENSWKKTGKGDPGEATSIPAFGARGRAENLGMGLGIGSGMGAGVFPLPVECQELKSLDQTKLWKTPGKRLEEEIREKPPASQPLVPEAERKTWEWDRESREFSVPPERRELKVGVGLSATPGNSSSF
ncbi:hypothetical protein DUI87_00503 [Hirundo rustica rustica]|uniref:Uncharacterized protein n=1 Tax=Hirundo rustica rustica TaxID=333673 RepID=A0A3M0LB66_HIRRU|nr:hypothetical protein DUI87_00503 [Hirundo rustica rustica]